MLKPYTAFNPIDTVFIILTDSKCGTETKPCQIIYTYKTLQAVHNDKRTFNYLMTCYYNFYIKAT